MLSAIITREKAKYSNVLGSSCYCKYNKKLEIAQLLIKIFKK